MPGYICPASFCVQRHHMSVMRSHTGLKHFRADLASLLPHTFDRNGRSFCAAFYCIIPDIFPSAATKSGHSGRVTSSPGSFEAAGETQNLVNRQAGRNSGGVHDASDFPYVFPRQAMAALDQQRQLVVAMHPSTPKTPTHATAALDHQRQLVVAMHPSTPKPLTHAEFPYIFSASNSRAEAAVLRDTAPTAARNEAENRSTCSNTAQALSQPPQTSSSHSSPPQADFPFIYPSLSHRAASKLSSASVGLLAHQRIPATASQVPPKFPYIFPTRFHGEDASAVSSASADKQQRSQPPSPPGYLEDSATFPNIFPSSLQTLPGATHTPVEGKDSFKPHEHATQTTGTAPGDVTLPDLFAQSPQSPSRQAIGTAAGVEVLSAEQDVEDPWSWKEDSLGSVDVRKDGPVGSALRGHQPMQRMKSWVQMENWIEKYEGEKRLFPTEISRMWTKIVEVCRAKRNPAIKWTVLCVCMPESDYTCMHASSSSSKHTHNPVLFCAAFMC
jgi:hypothetical protein